MDKYTPRFTPRFSHVCYAFSLIVLVVVTVNLRIMDQTAATIESNIKATDKNLRESSWEQYITTLNNVVSEKEDLIATIGNEREVTRSIVLWQVDWTTGRFLENPRTGTLLSTPCFVEPGTRMRLVDKEPRRGYYVDVSGATNPDARSGTICEDGRYYLVRRSYWLKDTRPPSSGRTDE